MPLDSRHVGEPHRPGAIRLDNEVVAVQTIAGHLGRRYQRSASPERRPLHEKRVQVAVVVVVEERRAWRHDLRLVKPAGHAVEVHEIEAKLASAVGEPVFPAAGGAGGRCA